MGKKELSQQEKEASVLIAKRLKELRKEKGLSHEMLSAALKEQYGVVISRYSLMNYEVEAVNHTSFGSNIGMSVNYLRCLSDFYGVSADWILGKSDYRSKATEATTLADVGLSEEASDALKTTASLMGKGVTAAGINGDRMMSGFNCIVTRTEFWLLCQNVDELREAMLHRLQPFDSDLYKGGELPQLTQFFGNDPSLIGVRGIEALQYRLSSISDRFRRFVSQLTGLHHLEAETDRQLSELWERMKQAEGDAELTRLSWRYRAVKCYGAELAEGEDPRNDKEKKRD